MLRSVRRLITAGVLLALTVIVFILAKCFPQLWFSFYPAASKAMLSAIGTVTGAFPFCLWELLLVGLVLLGIVSFIFALKKKHLLRWLCVVAELASALLFLFVFLWGLNHFGPKVSQKLGLSVREYSVEELQGATQYYADLASSYAGKVERNEDGSLVMPPFSELSAQAARAIRSMPQPLFSSSAPTVKPLLSSRLFSYMGITGIYVDLTAEPCVNTETFETSLPYTMCHELSHSCAVTAEDDANYCAFLICEHSDDALFLYSGYYSAYVYCHNALFKKDRNAAVAIYNANDPLLIADCGRASEYYDRFEGEVQEVSTKVNDTYLKTFGQEKGVQSYGAVTDQLIAHWLLLSDR